MSDPSERRFTFKKIADDLSGGKACQENRISNLLVSDLWNGEFDPQKLCWNVYNALLVLDPYELPDDTPPSPVYDAEKRADAQTIPLEPHQSIAGLDELETESLVRRANAISGGEKFTGQSDRVALILFLLDCGRNEQAPAAVTKSAPVKPAGPKQAPGVAEDMTGDDVSKFFENTTEGDEAKENSSRSDDFQETSREELYGLLSIVGEPLASDKANFPRLAQFELNQYIAASQVILMNVAIPADEVRHFCDLNDLKTHKRYVRALTPDNPDGAVKEKPQPSPALVSKDGGEDRNDERPEPEQPEHGPSAVRPNRRGRKKGIGGYDSKDMPLIEEMHRLIEIEEVTGPWDAALKVVDEAPGAPNIDSRLKRLTRKYAAKYSPDKGLSD